jgi:hypothetical protein
VRTTPIDAVGHPPGVLVIEGTTHGDDVASHDRVRRICQGVGELRVGRQQQQTGAGHVQTTDGDKRFCCIAEHIEYGRSAIGIVASRDHPLRLVKGDRAPLSPSGLCAVNRNRILLGDDKTCGVADDAAGDANAPIRDQLLRFRSRGDAKLGECSVEPSAAHHFTLTGSIC